MPRRRTPSHGSPPRRLIRHLAAAIAVSLALAEAPAIAQQPLPEPEGEAILTVSGAIERTNSHGRAVFDLAMLKSLPVTRYETSTIWTRGTHVFEGVLLGDLLNALGADGVMVRATALNDYAVDIPVNGGDEAAALIAYHRDGEEMPVRDNGPLWIVYPYDDDAAYRSEVIYARSIWQLTGLVVD